uniref:DUF2235 domain-containing protein n=1 Tax=Corethron hystrix TaxID=216773 RepID=A0A7S1BU59_9STRA
MVTEEILIVFFEGTSNVLKPCTTQIGIFAAACRAVDVSDSPIGIRRGPFKIAFDGCGVNSLTGVLFASGLTAQCRAARERVREILARDKSCTVRVVAVGLSRGGIACIRLGLDLAAAEFAERTSVVLLLYDPVAGDAVSTGFPFTGMGAKDLRSCTNLKRVLALYPHEPLPDIAMHAPTLVAYPPSCEVEEDVTLGCHQGALFRTHEKAFEASASNLSFRRIADFLEEEGIELGFGSAWYEVSHADCLSICRAALRQNHPTTRILHDGMGLRRKIVRHGIPLVSDTQTRWFLNRQHEQLERKIGNSTMSPSGDVPQTMYMLAIEPSQGCF